ncbi:hypothetical protein WJX75_007588 [Coccomyxa subellipsoidea]|uniref:Uncharacterized protein n=1 Tax=Coccomyxa subellipsoidea TaxID=248742 RepID=A0ABR2YWL7_9CHLO
MSALRLPRLRMKDDIINADPDLAVYLEEAFEQVSSHIGAFKQLPRAMTSAGTDLLGLSLDDELTEEEELRTELESAKRERRALMDSLAALKGDQGKAGSELQMADITRLRRELEVKQEKINEIRQASTFYSTKVPSRQL